MSVTTGSSVLKFTLKELEDLVNDVDSQIHLKKDVKYPLKLTPACLQNVNQAITEILTAERLKYIPKYKGLLLAYKNVRRHSNMGTINDDECNILIHIHVDLYIFAPEIGCTMTGIVSKISEDNIGCLVHKGFNVTLPQPRNDSSAEWLGNSVRLGDEVRFKLDTFNVVGTLPYIRGTLLSHKSVKRESGLIDFLEECDLPIKKNPAVEKRKKHALKEEETASETLKKPSKKKKKISEEDDEGHFMEESLPDSVKAKKERKMPKKLETAVAETSDTVIVKKAKKEKKRKSDPIAGPSIEPEPQISSKKRQKLSGSTASDGGYKTSLLQFLHSDDEGGDDKFGSQSTEEKKKKTSKSALPKQDLTEDNKTDFSVEALMQNARRDIGGETMKSKPKPRKSLADLLASESDNDDSFENEATKLPHQLQTSDSSDAFEDVASKKDAFIETSLTKKLKTPKSKGKTGSNAGEIVAGKTKKTAGSAKKAVPERNSESDSHNLEMKDVSNSPILVETSGSAKKKKVKPAVSTTDNIGDMSIEELMQRALENVSGKTPKAKKSRALHVADEKQMPKESPGKNKPENVVALKPASEKNKKPVPEKAAEEKIGTLAKEAISKSAKKIKTKQSDLSVSTDILQTPSKLAGKKMSKSGLLDLLHADVVVPNPEELLSKVQNSKSPKKKLKNKPDERLDNGEIMQMPSKLAENSKTGSSKKKSKSSLSDFLHEDVVVPMPEELLAKMQELQTKSPKKKNKTKPSEPLVNGEVKQTPSKLTSKSEATSSSPKKMKGKKASTMDNEDFDLLTPAEIVEKLLAEQLKSPKKKSKSKPSDLVESEDILPTPSKVTAISESSSKKKRKSGLVNLLHEDTTELLDKMQEENKKSPNKTKKTKLSEPSENEEIVKTPSKLAETSESSSSKRKSKSNLLGFLHDDSGSEAEDCIDSQPPVAKSPAKIRKAFVQSPISGVTKKSKTPKVKKAPTSDSQTPPPSLPPLPSLGQLTPCKEENTSSKHSSSPKKLRQLGTVGLLEKLLSREKSETLGEVSASFTPSSKKKSKK